MRLRTHPRRDRFAARAGISIVEVMLVMTLLTVGIGMFASTLGSVMRLGPSLRESARAVEGVRSLIEEMRAQPFGELFARYNADPADDPGGPGSAPGCDFAVTGLVAVPGDPDGWVGRVSFPEVAGDLREDLVDDSTGMPRDLNLDGLIDGLDHASDYAVVPIVVRLDWQGRGPARSLRVHTTIARP
jgi:hypothetical protein